MPIEFAAQSRHYSKQSSAIDFNEEDNLVNHCSKTFAVQRKIPVLPLAAAKLISRKPFKRNNASELTSGGNADLTVRSNNKTRRCQHDRRSDGTSTTIDNDNMQHAEVSHITRVGVPASTKLELQHSRKHTHMMSIRQQQIHQMTYACGHSIQEAFSSFPFLVLL